MKPRGVMIACVLPLLWVATSFAQAEDDGMDHHPEYERAQTLLSQGIWMEAVHALESYIKNKPDDMAARMEAANILFQLGMDRAAADHAGWVHSSQPAHQESRRLLIRIRSRMAINLDRTDPDDVLYFARLARLLNNVDRARHYYELSLQLRDDPAIHLEIARAARWWHRPEWAVQSYRDYLHTNPGDAAIRHELGQLLNQEGRHAEASDELAMATGTAETRLVQAELDLARALLWSGRAGEAADWLERLTHERLVAQDARLMLAGIRHDQQRYREAQMLYRGVLEQEPGHPEALIRIKDYEWQRLLEIEVLRDALSRNPEDMETRYALIELYWDRQRYADARHELDLLAFVAPRDPMLLTWQRRLNEREETEVAGRLEEFRSQRETELAPTIRRLELWVRHNANDDLAKQRLAGLLAQSGRYREAHLFYEDLAKRAPNNPMIASALRRMEQQRGLTAP